MRKQEYIHVHALLVQVTEYLVEHENMPADTFARYEELRTRPSSIHQAKQNHHEAVMELSGDIEPWLEAEIEDAPKQRVEEAT